MNYYEIGQRIRAHRRSAGLSQEQLAEQIDISTTHMSHIETGNTKLSLPVLVSLAKALRVGTDELLFGQRDQSEIMGNITALLQTCNANEASLLYEIMKCVKTTIDRQK